MNSESHVYLRMIKHMPALIHRKEYFCVKIIMISEMIC